MTYGILGPLEVGHESVSVRIGSHGQRLLLAVLLVDANRVVSNDRLVDELWESDLPADPAGALRTQVSRLRKALRSTTSLSTEIGGYRLHLDESQIDAARFEQLLDAARHAADEHALTLIDESLGLWRGAALEEFADRPFARSEALRLDELRDDARERRAGLLSSAGRHAEAAAALEPLLAQQPQREGARARLMEALYHLGRHTEALALYQSWRTHLAEDHGLEPSPELRRLEQQILDHAPELRRAGTPVARLPSAPRPVTSFVGRNRDLPLLLDLLDRARHVTLWGPGGVGKTRLSLEVARAAADRYPDGVYFCDLGAVSRPMAVVRAVATTLGVQEKAFRPLETQVLDHLAGRRALVILDNCEHVLVGAAPFADRVVRTTPAVDVLATSRTRFGVEGEHLWEVEPLDTEGTGSAAVMLFLDRARATKHDLVVDVEDLGTLEEVCGRLDGLPLAIELAAARVRGCSFEELLRSLDARPDILTGGAGRDRRHRSLGAVLDWSYRQLQPVEQQVFDRLGVFAGPFDMDDATAVVVGDGIDETDVPGAVLRLLDCSLVAERSDRGPLRYSLLDTMRRYALERLTTSDAVVRRRDQHARWAVGLAERAAIGLGTADESRWADAVRHHIDEFRAAHTWLVGRDEDWSLRLVVALRPYALWRAASEPFRWAEVAVAAAAGTGSSLLPDALLAAFTGAWQRGDLEAARMTADAIRDALPRETVAASRPATESAAELAMLSGDLSRAVDLFFESAEMARREGDLLQATWDLGSASLAICYDGQAERARDVAEQVLAVAGECGSPSAEAFAHFTAGEALVAVDPAHAEEELLQSIASAETVGSRFVVGLAEVALVAAKIRQEDIGTALDYCTSAITEWHRAGAWTPLWVTLRTAVLLLQRVGALEEAAVLLGAAQSRGTGGALYGADAAMLRDAGLAISADMGDADFGRATAEGEAMSDEAVVAHALNSLVRCRSGTP